MAKKKITNFNEDFDLKLFVIIAKSHFYWVLVLMTSPTSYGPFTLLFPTCTFATLHRFTRPNQLLKLIS